MGPSSRSPAAAIPPPMHDPVRRDDDDHVGDADPEVAADLGEAVGARASPARARRDRLLGRGGPAGGGDLVGPGERLEAAAVAAAAPRSVGIDRLVADLAGRAVVALVHAAVDREHAADAGAERQPDHRPRAAAGAQSELGEAEGPGVVDQEGGQRRAASATGPATGWPAHGPGTLTRKRVVPVAGSYSPGTPIPTVDRRTAPGDGVRRDLDQLRHDRGRHGVRLGHDPGRDPIAGDGRPGIAVVLDDGPLDVRCPEVEPEMAGRRSGLVGHRSVARPLRTRR